MHDAHQTNDAKAFWANRRSNAPRRICTRTSAALWLPTSRTLRRSPTRLDSAAPAIGYMLVSCCRRMRNRFRKPAGSALVTAVVAGLLTACATPPMTSSGVLSSYSELPPVKNGRSTKSRVRVNTQDVLAARTVRILPTRFAEDVGAGLSEKDRGLVTNVIDRSLCRSLSKRFDVVGGVDPTDLSVRAVITHLGTTNQIAAGASAAIGFIPSALTSIPIVSPRVPVGLGSLTIEAEALDRDGEQDAAMIWASGADAVLSAPRVSEVGDAYQLASEFGRKFSELLVTGEQPSGKLKLPKLPKIGGSKKDTACEVYGSGPGILGKITESIALPPSVADKGREAEKEAPEEPGAVPSTAQTQSGTEGALAAVDAEHQNEATGAVDHPGSDESGAR